MSGFFEAFRKKLEREPRPGFDTRFWARFDGEFERKTEWYRLLVPLAAAGLAVTSYFMLRTDAPSSADTELAQVLAESPELLEEDDPELFSEVDDVAISDDEWEVLVET